jgi:NEDD8-activating enzyme E1 regulatory subunit
LATACCSCHSGIGRFTIVDGKRVDDSDSNNFFVDDSSQGKSRAEVTTNFLKELNDLVKGECVDRDPVEIISKDISFFKPFTMVIANSIPEIPLRTLGRFCWDNGIPLLVVRSYGFLGYLRIAVKEHTGDLSQSLAALCENFHKFLSFFRSLIAFMCVY